MDLPDVTKAVEEAEEVIRQCFKQFNLDEVFLSFNGGKDCTVLLDMTINVLREIYNRDDVAKDLKIVYIRTNGPFKEIEEFVNEIGSHYGVQLQVFEGEIKSVLQRILDQDVSIKACLMGTRRTDPYSDHLKFIQKTDSNWPQVFRVSPILNWTYHEVWSYILQRKVPYCSLYDKGYTSIGSTLNTRPNDSLAHKDSSGCVSYYPAWRLSDAALERAGRISASKQTVNVHANGTIKVNLELSPEVRNGSENLVRI